MVAAVNIGGAVQRLLPERIPLRFFGSAAGFHIVSWLALGFNAEHVASFVGGADPILAAVHALTLGVLVMTAMGASLQMLPVALGRAAPSVTVCNLVFFTFLAGSVLLIIGFALIHPMLVQAGAVLTAAAAGVYVVSLVGVISGAAELSVVVLHVWAALVSLVLAIGLGIALGANYAFGFLADHQGFALAHVVLAGYGFMGMLVLGLSQVVIPLFAVTPPARGRWPLVAFAVALAGLTLATFGILRHVPSVVAGAIAAGLVASGLHVWTMNRQLAGRMRRRLGVEFVLIRASWVLLPLSILVAGGLALDALPASAPALFGFVLLYGWLLTVLMGVLQRILPFLASMHTGRSGRAPAPPSQLTAEQPLLIHRWSHLVAVAVVGFGITMDVPEAVVVGAAVGTFGAAAFAAFTVSVFRRMRTHLDNSAISDRSNAAMRRSG